MYFIVCFADLRLTFMLRNENGIVIETEQLQLNQALLTIAKTRTTIPQLNQQNNQSKEQQEKH